MNPEPTFEQAVEAFSRHKDECQQCDRHPMAPCDQGRSLMTAAARAHNRPQTARKSARKSAQVIEYKQPSLFDPVCL